MLRSGKVDVLVFFGRRDRPPTEAMPIAIACLEQENLGFDVLCWEPKKAIRAEKIVDGRSTFPPSQGTFRKIGVQFWRKVDVARYTRRFSDTAG